MSRRGDDAQPSDGWSGDITTAERKDPATEPARPAVIEDPFVEQTVLDPTDSFPRPGSGEWDGSGTTAPSREPIPAQPTIVGELRIGALVGGGRYRLDEKLAEGGMGSVFIATQLGMGRAVAIKFLRSDIVGDPQMVKRFNREASTLSSISHPNVVRVFDFGIDPESSSPFLVLELIRGRTLDVLLAQDGPLGERRAQVLLAQAARALLEIHAKGLVHRDLKPENLMVETLHDRSEHLRIIDFGLAKLFGTDEGGAREELTVRGVMLGTPTYMAPEQAAGDAITSGADVYALGCILHFVLTGGPPFTGKSYREVATKQIVAPVPPLPLASSTGVAISDPLRDLHAAMLAKAPKDRPDIERVIEVLSAYGPDETVDSRRTPIVTSKRRRPGAPRVSGTKAEAGVPWLAIGIAALTALLLSAGLYLRS